MSFIDYYKILGIEKSATEKDIKKAYRKLARKYHPDLNPNNKDAEKNFKEINEANEVLSHVENRKKYDKYGKDWEQAEHFENAERQQQYSRGNQQKSTGGYSESDYSDFFESMFGGAKRPSHGKVQYKGQDFNAELKLNLTDVYTTHKQTLTVNGKNIRLTIPAGIKDGQIIKIKGYGSPGINGGPHGDLHIKFAIFNNTPFKRDKDNLYKTIDLELYTAILGGDITVDTFDGKVKLTVKPETENETKIKLKGKGFPVYKKEDQYGDLYITYQLKTPTNLSDKEIELFNELAKLRTS